MIRNDDISELRRRAREGAGLLDLVDLVGRQVGLEMPSRGHVMAAFSAAFGLGPLDFLNVVFACEIFGDGATVSVSESERRFRDLMVQRGWGMVG